MFAKKLLRLLRSQTSLLWKLYFIKEELTVDASTVSRQFKKRFGMTCVEYAALLHGIQSFY
ncbi:hypothetical protein [Rickettsia endosymbiont of Ceutorhynchus obstrictus]|uniref:hypothetical protein n=1 Tax=Rickettsia endosymbiont of Ceutorhynchus obstrictus TaxID=3066249 RepID=UPI003132C6BB